MQAQRTPLTDEEVALWTDRAKRCLEEALSEIEDGVEAFAPISLADTALRIAAGEIDPAELDGYEFPGEEPPEPPCICPPELVERGGYKGGCPRHGLAR